MDARMAMHAAREAARCRRQHVGTPHLLLGLVSDPNGRPAEALRSMGFSILEVEGAVLRKLGPPVGRSRRFKPGISDRLEQVLVVAEHEAARAGRRMVRAEDLLMALAADPDGKAARVLQRLRGRAHSVATA
jgi:ATP-dependent Clp protease ATP-binding subunit ClpC